MESVEQDLKAQPARTADPLAGHVQGRKRLVALLSLLGATLFWAGNYVVGAGAVQSIDPLSLVFRSSQRS